MLKVTFKITHPDKDFDQIVADHANLFQGSDYSERMAQNMADGILLYRTTANENGEYVHYTIWKDRASNEAWTQSIYDTPSTKKFYDNLIERGYTFTVTKEDL